MERSANFITFEGIDGSGKTTQLFKLFDYIWNSDKYNKVVPTREPYERAKIRQILKQDDDPYANAKELAKLFVEDRKLHIAKFILPCLNNGIDVLCDRYDCSTFAYQQTQGIPLEELMQMHKGLPIPDLTFITDLPIELALQRIARDKNRAAEKKFETDVGFIEKLAQNYLELPGQLADRNFFIIDGSLPTNEIFNEQTLKVYKHLFEE